ncbi:unnamed protein product, partial [Choristocarpus tenellus]
GLEDSVSSWFEGDSMQSFFEFQTARDAEAEVAFQEVDLVATKSYSARGVVTIGIWFDGMFYVVLAEGGEENPLLDSRFPDVSSKGRGYQIRAMTEGPDGWEQLRKVSVWQTAAALEQEMEKRNIKSAGEKKEEEGGGGKGKGRDIRGSSPIELSDAATERLLAFRKQQGTGAGTGLRVEAAARAGEGTGGGTGLGKRVGENEVWGVGDEATGSEGERTSRAGEGNSALAQPKEPFATRGGNRHGRNGDDDNSGPQVAGAKEESGSAIQSRLEAAKPLTKTKVALPHHLTPMEGLQGKLQEMRENMGNDLGDAPWDTFGRPKTALGAKMQHK